MNSLHIKPSLISPEVNFDLSSNEFEISGQSIITEVHSFYGPIIDWLELCSENPPKELIVRFRLNYYNLASAKRFMFMVYLFSKMKRKGTDVKIEWNFYQDDEFMHEFGTDLSDHFDIHFDLKIQEVTEEELSLAS